MSCESKLLSFIVSVAAVLVVSSVSALAHAEPILQLYIEGGEYDTETESWEISSADGDATVWVIANTDGGGSQGTVFDVNLVVAYDADSTEAAVTYDGANQFEAAGSGTGVSPTLTDGSVMPEHGVYGDDTSWQQFSLGDFTETSDPLADFDEDFDPSTLSGSGSDTEAYAITLHNVTGTVHLDAFGYTINEKNEMQIVWTAPFSHDANVHTPVPELPTDGLPPALALLAGGALILMGRRRSTS